MLKRLALTLLISVAFVITASADIVDFESTGLNEGDPVLAVTTTTNTVTFSSAGGTNCFLAAVGAPTAGFGPDDTPAGGVGGSFFLSDKDERAGAHNDPYFLNFGMPVRDLRLNVYDYRGDGGGAIGNVIVLEVFADPARTVSLGTSSYTVPSVQPEDGNVVTLEVLTGNIRSASVTYDPDNGTGIDDIEFESEPPPIPTLSEWGFVLLAIILLGSMVWLSLRSRKGTAARTG